MCKSATEELTINVNGNISVKSPTTNASCTEDDNKEEKISSFSHLHQQSELNAPVSCVNITNGEGTNPVTEEQKIQPNHAQLSNTDILPNNTHIYSPSRTDKNNSLQKNTTSTSVVTNSNGEKPITIFKADYPFFETTL